MAKNFLDEEEHKPSKLTYMDGFRFGFGFFVANLIGLAALAAIAAAIGYALPLLR